MKIDQFIIHCLNATHVSPIETVQTLWSGYGEIVRYQVDKNSSHKQVIVKSIRPPQTHIQSVHPKGWNTSASHIRKLKSYQVECNWYRFWSSSCSAHIPHCYGVLHGNIIHTQLTNTVNSEQITKSLSRHVPYMMTNSDSEQMSLLSQSSAILLSDLDDQGFPVRHETLTINQAKICIKWLAELHGTFMQDSPPSSWPTGLWQTGSYWQLNTRGDEYLNMPDSALKQSAYKLDELLNKTRFKTIIHGDAKVANFCFNESSSQVSAVDFQYTGGGCGMRDLVYFLGSCLSEIECKNYHRALTHYYFEQLSKVLLENTEINPIDVEQEWAPLFDIAWADFQRFILGWSATHKKNNGFSQCITEQALLKIK